MVLTEQELFNRLDSAKNVLLIEPNYPTKYPPFALAKIKTYLKKRNINAEFSDKILPKKFDLICMTTLFTYYSSYVFAAIKNKGFFNKDTPIIVGGIFASLMPKQFDQFKNVDIFKGYSKILDMQKPDEEIMSKVDEKWSDFSWVFTTRGCPNKCAYCTVWRIEKENWVNPEWKSLVSKNSKILSLLDNNISSSKIEHIQDIVDFTSKRKLRLLIESGVDCKYVTKELADQLSKIKYARHGMRTAFDRIEEDGIFQNAALTLQNSGINPEDMMAYVLFNFTDKPHEAEYRTEQCYKLKIRAYPQCYVPLNTLVKKSRFVGKHWTFRLTKAFRNFWIMKGIRHGFPDTTFGEYIQTKEGRAVYSLMDNDIDIWNSNGR